MTRFIKKQTPLYKSIQYATEGLIHAYYSQRNIKIHTLCCMIAIGFAFYFKITYIEWLMVLCCSAMVISFELINTAIELSIDLVTKEKRLRAKLSKDVAAGAVMIASINAIVIGYLIFFDRFVTLFKGG